jgi:hypothetical protein
MQVRGYVEVLAGAVCKTVGSAYVGSNPTPATTSGNGHRAAETRPGGPFPSCHGVYQGVSPRVDAWQRLRTNSGQRPGGTSGAYNRSLCQSAPVLSRYPGAGTAYRQEVHTDRLYADLAEYNLVVENPRSSPAWSTSRSPPRWPGAGSPISAPPLDAPPAGLRLRDQVSVRPGLHAGCCPEHHGSGKRAGGRANPERLVMRPACGAGPG